MRKPLHMSAIGLLFLLPLAAKAQISMSWITSVVPGWNNGNSSGNAPNVGGVGIAITTNATIVGSGVFMFANGNSGVQTPTVTGATLTVPGTLSSLQVAANFA